MSKKSIGVASPEQLKGKKIGINSPESAVMTKVVLASQGLGFEDITPVQTGWELGPLINDEIDVYAAFMNNDPLNMRELGYEVAYIPAFKHGYDFHSGVCFASETMIKAHLKRIRDFLAVTLRGWKSAFKDPVGTAGLVVEKYYPQGSARQQAESLKMFQMLSKLGEGRKYPGWMKEKYWAKGIDILHKFGQIEKKIPATDVFTSDFLKEILKFRTPM